jgi:hypothetical protein
MEMVDMLGTEPEPPAGIKDVQREMARIRLEMHQEVAGAANGVHLLTDWRNIVRDHPWASVATAALVGYVVVRRFVPRSAPRSSDRPVGRSWHPARELGSFSWRVITPIAERIAQVLLLQQVEGWLADRSTRRASSEQGPYSEERREWTAPVGDALGPRPESAEVSSLAGGVAGLGD